MYQVFGNFYVGKAAHMIFLGEDEDKKKAMQIGAAFLRERSKKGARGDFRIFKDGDSVACVSLIEQKPMEITVNELDLLERGAFPL